MGQRVDAAGAPVPRVCRARPRLAVRRVRHRLVPHLAPQRRPGHLAAVHELLLLLLVVVAHRHA